MLLVYSLLWLAGLLFAMWKRDKQKKKFVKRLKTYIDEQERQEQKIRRAAEKADKDSAETSTAEPGNAGESAN